jgi:hypothetical protein
MNRLEKLDGHRFVGNLETREVHDRWHEECEDSLMEAMVEDGVAVAFEPDTLDGALNEGFETCPYCFDKTDPKCPRQA